MATPTHKIGLRRKRPVTPESARVREWILANRGVLSTVAKDKGVSPQYVQKVAYGRTDGPSRGDRIERALEKLGCPVIRTR